MPVSLDGRERRSPDTDPSSPGRRRRHLAQASILVLVLTLSGILAGYWMTHRPQVKRQSPPPSPRLVRTSTVSAGDERIVISAMGTVVPARHIVLATQVSGKVLWIHPKFVPGAQIKAGEQLVRIDSADYDLAVRQRESELEKVRSELVQELGQQSVAQQEVKLLTTEPSAEERAFILRQPQLNKAEALVKAAETALSKARLDLQRTSITAPFNAALQTREVDLGSYVGIGTRLCSLVNTDRYWVELNVPVDTLRWLEIPDYNCKHGSAVVLRHEPAWGSEGTREGRVLRLLTDLEPHGRMARILVEVDDPLHLRHQTERRRPLILGSFVAAELQGVLLSGIRKIPRGALREGRHIWVLTAGNTLDLRSPSIVWESEEFLYLDAGVEPGERLITSDLGAVTQGMLLRSMDDAPTPPAGVAPQEPMQGKKKQRTGHERPTD
ncbi:MAG: hypothetical protein A2284_08640 [Deltaproteobacteria bacterium RIFOXYA12_FULL_61_11]|nr:MAG: hypothetical protein A2284_08640 [Deltaproteobacteria bacterium RIFOXYA12_FULL_61_11]